MGDRGNIFFVDDELSESQWGGVYMYTHWSGSVLPQIVQQALQRGKSRWGDPQYFARIVFCELVGEDIQGTTGFGLGTRIGDNEHLIVRVNDLEGTVSFCEPGMEADRTAEPVRTWGYEEFVDAADFEEWFAQ